MERSLKFRAWDKKTKEMFLVEQLNFDHNGELLLAIGYEGRRDLQKCELMQFTGLLDKSGILIYEGDVLIFRLDFYTDAGDIGGRERVVENKYCYVKWEQESCSWILSNYGGRLMQSGAYEVIGNIYQNKELIKVQGKQP